MGLSIMMVIAMMVRYERYGKQKMRDAISVPHG